MINPLLEMELYVRVLKSHVAVYCNISQLNVSFKTQHWNRQHSEKITAADRPQIPQLTLLALVSGMILDILPKCKTQAICDVYYHFYSITSLLCDAKHHQNVRGMHNWLFWIISKCGERIVIVILIWLCCDPVASVHYLGGRMNQEIDVT